jgi:transposase
MDYIGQICKDATMPKFDGRKLDHKTSEHLRILAVRRVREDGEAPSAVMRSLGLCRTTVYRWLRAYDQGGEDALKAHTAKGPEPKLNDAQRKIVREWILGKDPRQYGFDFGLWTRAIVAAMVQERFGISLGLTAVGRMLAELEITPQKPLRRAYERDPQAVMEWKQKAYPKLRRRAKRAGASIYFLDEAGFTSEPPLGKTYGLKGKTPVVSTSGQRQKVNAISAVNARGAFWSQVYTGNFNATRFVEFLEDFRRGGRGKVFLVVDGHPSHHAKLVQRYVEQTNGMLELHFIPPYAPDLNPDEFVWQYAKTNGLSKKPLKKNESLAKRVQQDLDNIKNNPGLVRSFFRAESVDYAKD